MITATVDCVIRKAVAAEEPAIQALVRRERLNPNHLHFENFAVALKAGELIGASQIRRHRDGSRELGSLVVAPAWRGLGISRQIIGWLLAQVAEDVYVITRAKHAGHYSSWGFAAVPARAAPAAIRRNFRIGSTVATVMALLERRQVNRMVILRRPGSAWHTTIQGALFNKA